MTERCIWVSLPHATFGIVTDQGRVTDAAPIAKWAIGKDEREVAAYYRREGAVFTPAAVPAARPDVRPGMCPGCRTARLAHGRQVCQACGVVQIIRAQDADAEAGQ